MAEKFIKIQALYGLLELEPFILLGCLIAITWVFYKFFLREATEERHRSIRNHFRALIRNYVILAFLFVFFIFLQTSEPQLGTLAKITPYIAFLTFIWGNVVLVKTCRLIVLQYLFLGSMKHGVPLLLVNIFSLILSIVLLFWGATHVFGLQIGPLLATSAAASVILGLALQDTLGNLFAGISLQVDRSFEIGDWLEVVSGIQKTAGQVKEITWRSTTLVGFSDELITLPNRFMANATISNFSPPENPIVRSQFFRLAYGENVELAKQILERTVAGIGEVRGIPAPWAYVSSTNEHWIELKIIYFLDNYGSQFNVGDKVQVRGIEALRSAGVKLARQVIELSDKTPSV
ncbi:mechanosensitive ion channel family protein [Bdellovibrio sp. 22V]|uniref:mechanosensitive ion channel family protein n=1 Tax=Bdellovibrio TaxID=958 RepID=UPI002543749A|nr:mechanosensitive ion channel family protein [Bdellovibrio sp. 22V]WII71086.1 mechanosensitive ion channel family protein [Bdellovibrio sp. 22V]